jgi:hypothetical protein
MKFKKSIEWALALDGRSKVLHFALKERKLRMLSILYA